MIHKSKGWVGLVVIVASLSLQYPVFAQDDAASGNVVYLPVVQSNISNDSSNAVAAAAPTPPVVVSAVATVDMTDDPKGLGYPDSRKIAQDTSGNPAIAYRKSSPPAGSCSSTAQHIFVARKSSSPAWIPERIDNGLCKTQRVPSISIDAQNKLLVSWYGQQNSATQTNDRQIFFSQSTAFNSWSTPALPNVIAFPISGTFPTLWQEHPVIFASPLNTIDILWQSRDASHLANSLIRFTRSTNGTSWTNVTLPDAVLDGTTTLTGEIRKSVV